MFLPSELYVWTNMGTRICCISKDEGEDSDRAYTTICDDIPGMGTDDPHNAAILTEHASFKSPRL